MRLPDYHKILKMLPPSPILSPRPQERLEGRILSVGTTMLRAYLPGIGLGELCTLPDGNTAEVVALEGEQAFLTPYREPQGLACGTLISPTGEQARIGVGPALLGRVVDSLGRPVDRFPDLTIERWQSLESEPPEPLSRTLIDSPLPTGVRAIDATLTIGEGQRLGIFAPAGCGKSTLLGMVAANSEAEVVVVALIGERGREVREFLELVMTPDLRERSVVVLATSDRPALERLKAAATATTIAEYFRDQGRRVLLLVDSLTRYARAIREIALATGEPIVGSGYPPSLYARLPRLLERAGPATRGSITAFYSVLMEEKNDPLAEEVRSLLDGHIVLSRSLAEANHYPAIDILASISRVMNQITTRAHQEAASRLRHLLAAWQEVELLVRVGEYKEGEDLETDDAIARRPAITAFLCQSVDEPVSLSQTLATLSDTVGLPC
ncbi:FliI/YscN family ATPase [Salmonella enterica]|nr:EscN/YscN/HrcN family type III secretion system ATPase [Salmonella enterica subsp. enterica serovar Sandiego]EEC0251695.1 FliI/YscN family ATPase [Salmonella enterica subsp. enterica]EJW2129036.1 FliI/YscN family ATPase [Salmonella enterica]EEE4266812.1 FliI/YscN family ATPase [Salmonella enterica subsp. enterica serovar Sandiego]EKT1704968.1 FliI/YscN family ATPase [Salmonella enterica]